MSRIYHIPVTEKFETVFAVEANSRTEASFLLANQIAEGTATELVPTHRVSFVLGQVTTPAKDGDDE